MAVIEGTYEDVRKILSPKFCYDLPNNEQTLKLISNIFPGKEADIIANGFKKAFRPRTARKIRKRTIIPDV